MITLNETTSDLIKSEMESIPEKYQKPFNSTHEGYAVILEEVRELEHQVFFGEKECAKRIRDESEINYDSSYIKNELAPKWNKLKMKEECIQIAAMCCRFIQELT